ncbi:MAG TPA: membrane protein insertase YidC [Thermoanaerobaculia bacterium]|nr:membrane protein insertase YidC [Thermoanaerobaculia bacterium]
MDNRRLPYAVLLCALVFVLWQVWLHYFPLPPPLPPENRPEVREIAATGEGKAAAPAAAPGVAANQAAPSAGAIAVEPAVKSSPPAVAAEAAGEPAAPAGKPIAAAAEERVVLQGRQARAVFTNRGAQLLSLMVPEPGKGKELDLVRARAGGPYPYALSDLKLRPLPLNDVLFAVEKAADGRTATFRYNGPAGSAEKRFGFDERGLLAVEVKAGVGAGWGIVLGPGIGNPTAAELGSRYAQRGAVWKSGEDVKVQDPKSETELRDLPGRDLRWAGVEDTYFLAAAVPESGLARVLLQPVLVRSGADGARFIPVPPKDQLTSEQKDLNREFELVIEPAGDSLSLLCFWGPKNYEQLKSLRLGLEETVPLGSLSWVARPLLAGLHWIHDHVVANYGWAIILMTVLIKVLMLPLTHHSTLSMRKMQTLNPKMQSIREKYRPKLKDKQGRPNVEMQRKMNEEIMALYKAEGVNPAGGCLPLLLQMPILFAFYRLLSTSVELRHAPWIWWVQDLSAADPYIVLPLVMGVTQFLQVYFAPQSGDPMQRRLFLFMPVVMLAFFLPAPSGLVLYWLTNNVLTIFQQSFYNRFYKIEPAKP